MVLFALTIAAAVHLAVMGRSKLAGRIVIPERVGTISEGVLVVALWMELAVAAIETGVADSCDALPSIHIILSIVVVLKIERILVMFSNLPETYKGSDPHEL